MKRQAKKCTVHFLFNFSACVKQTFSVCVGTTFALKNASIVSWVMVLKAYAESQSWVTLLKSTRGSELGVRKANRYLELNESTEHRLGVE